MLDPFLFKREYMHRIRRWTAALAAGTILCLAPVSAQDDAEEFFQKLQGVEEVTEEVTRAAESPEDRRATMPTSSGRQASRIADRYKKPVAYIQQVIGLAEKYADPVFPKVADILAIITIESSFNANAFYLGNTGLMQINLAANGKKLRNRSLDENVRVGAALLREYYYLMGKSPRATVLSYNAGPGNYLKGRYNEAYFTKYTRARAWITSLN